MSKSKAVRLCMIFLVLALSVSLAACSKASPAASPAATTPVSAAPGQPQVPGKTPPAAAASGQPQVPGKTPSGTALPKPAAPTTPAVIIPPIQANIVRGSGTIGIATDANLSFDIGGKIARLYVKKGDRVTKEKLLAVLDTTSLESAVAQAQVNLDQALLTQTTATIALENAKLTLDKTLTITQIKDVITDLQNKIDIAEANVETAALSSGEYLPAYWGVILSDYKTKLAAENKALADLLKQPLYTGVITTYDITGQKYDRLTREDIRMKQLQVEAAQQTLDRSQDVIYQAQKNLYAAQKQLDNTVIYAPFNGVIATLNVKEGDIVSTPGPSSKPAMYIIDPKSMQIVVAVNELDIPRLKTGQKATVKINAFPGSRIEGKVTDISLLADVQGGVVNYGTTISFTVPEGMDIRSGMNAAAEITVS